MKKLFIATFLAMLIVFPTITLADGMWIPRYPTYDFTAVQEKQQYAAVEVLSNYFEKLNLYLALTSTDYETHNITVIVPLKSIPQNVDGSEIKASEFLSKYGFGDVEKLIEEQSLEGFVKKTSPITRDGLGEYFMLSVFTPVYELTKLAFTPFYAAAGEMARGFGATSTEYLPTGVEEVAVYEFEGVTVIVYDVDSGQTLEDFMRDYYDLDLPQNVRRSVDKYKMHYIALIEAEVGPPGDTALLKQHAPNTLRDALNYIKANPSFTFTCDYRYRTTYSGMGGEMVAPYYYGECTDRDAIRLKFSDFIDQAKTESGTAAKTWRTISIENAGFENNYLRWNRYGGYSGTTEEISTSVYRSGSRSYHVIDNDMNSWIARCQHIEVDTGKNYIARAYLKGESGTGLFWLTTNYPGGGGGECALPLEGDTVPSDWTQYSASCTPQYSNYMYVCVGSGTTIFTGDVYFDDITLQVEESAIENAMIDLFLAAYSNTTKGFELSMTLPIENAEIFYPLGTGIAWAAPIEDTKILVKMDKQLDVSFQNVQYSAIDETNRYYLWKFKNWNPDYDIVGTLSQAGPGTAAGDSGKMLLASMNANAVPFALFFLLICLVIGAAVVKVFGIGNPKRRTTFAILTFVFAPLLSVWLVAILAYAFKTKPQSKELKENFVNVLIFLGVIFLLWVIAGITAVLAGV